MSKNQVAGIDELIYNYRKSKKMSQAELARLLGKTQVTISNYENRTHFPKHAEEIKAIAQLLGIPVAQIIDAIEVARSGVVKEHEQFLLELNETTLENLLDKYKFTLDGEEIDESTLKETLDFLRYKRFKKNK